MRKGCTALRILMVSDFYFPYLGGVEQHVRTLSHELVKRGHSVASVSLGSPDLPAIADDEGVRVHRIRSSVQRIPSLFKHPKRTWSPPVPDPEAAWSLRRIVARERPDIVHGHDWLIRSYLPLGIWTKPELVISLHYYTLTCAKKSLMYDGAPCEGPAFRKCLACTSKHYGAAKAVPTMVGTWGMGGIERSSASMFLPVSNATATGNGLIERGLPFQVIPNFLPDEEPLPSRDDLAYAARLPDDFLLFVGDMRVEKGLGVLLHAYTQLREAPPLVLIGKVWPDTPKQFPPNVIVFEEWPNSAVMEAWRRCMIGLVPSIWPEPFGIVVIEAMAGGSPVIASNIGGIPDIVVDGQTGCLVPPGNPNELQRAIEHLLANPDLRRRMGEAGRNRVRQFRASAVVPQIESVYRQLLPHRQGIPA